MKRTKIILVLLAASAAAGVLIPVAQTRIAAAAKAERLAGIADLAGLLVEAERANSAHDIEWERSLLEQAGRFDGRPEDRAEVERRLAVLDWKYTARPEPARARLRAATDGAEPARTWLALARMEQALGNLDAAQVAARNALRSADQADERRRARLALAAALIEPSVEAALGGAGSVGDGLREGLELARQLVTEEPGQLEPSRRLLQAALLLGDGQAALEAWRSYYHVTTGGAAPNAVADAGERLTRLLPAWDGKTADEGQRRALVDALADSRFFLEAALVARISAEEPLDDPGMREVIAYAGFLRELGQITDEHYRRTSLGHGSKRSWIRELSESGRRFVAEAGIQIEIDEERGIHDLEGLLRERFGALINLGKTAGYDDLHMGHVVLDERRTVEQYGHTAQVRFLMLDQIVSNGFQSWAWEDGAEHGGWGGSTLIVQIRPAYMQGPQMAWKSLTDPEAREELEERLARETAADERRASDDPYGYLPGLALRLKKQAIERVHQRLLADGLEEPELRMAFLAEVERLVQESSIFAHEGRHAIDAAGAAPTGRTWKKEFRAKLSEVGFAPEPRLALGGIFNATIGSDTPHGHANARIMEELVGWMDRNRSEIEDLDDRRPLLPQFDLLTDDQMRAAFRSMDPLVG